MNAQLPTLAVISVEIELMEEKHGHQSLISFLIGKDLRRLVFWFLMFGLLSTIVFYSGKAILVDAHAPVRFVVYAFSTQEEVLNQGILPAFERQWEAETGKELVIEAVFGPSGTLAGQINLGAPADVAIFSNAQHVTWLKIGRVIRGDQSPVLVGLTPIVIITRSGYQGNIKGFADLAQPGLELVHADPRSSGGGEWAVLAEYGSSFLETCDRNIAEEQLIDIWRNVRLMAPSARAALTLFELGAGDALVTYEQDALLAQERGVALQIVVPEQTVVAQYVAVIVDDNITIPEKSVAKAFINFLQSDEGQRNYQYFHFRSSSLANEGFPELKGIFTVEDMGGWSYAYQEVIEDVWRAQIEPGLDLVTNPIPLIQGE